jgi:hypothetical protein
MVSQQEQKNRDEMNYETSKIAPLWEKFYQDNLKTNKELQQIVAVIGAYTKKELGFMCES